VFATSHDKDAAGMLRLLVPRFDRILLTRYLNNPRSVAPADLLQIARQIAADHSREQSRATAGNGRPRSGPPQLILCPDPASAHGQLVSDVAPDQLVCVTGSFFIAAEMRRLLSESPLGV
jgi:dihydrofolate synthase/folylpolyglutamate synthase